MAQSMTFGLLVIRMYFLSMIQLSDERSCSSQHKHTVYISRPGFAFVVFNNVEDAEKSVKELDGKDICGSRIKVEFAQRLSKEVSLYDIALF